MKKLLIAGTLFGCMFGIFGTQEAIGASVPQSSTETVVWPDYHQKDWVKQAPYPMVFRVNNDLKNPYLPYSVAVLLGEENVYLYLDKNGKPDQGVSEISVLGNETVVRALFISSPFGVVPIAVQMRIGKRWVDCHRHSGSDPRFYLLDPDKLLRDGELTGVLVSMTPLDTAAPPLEVRLQNKWENGPPAELLKKLPR